MIAEFVVDVDHDREICFSLGELSDFFAGIHMSMNVCPTGERWNGWRNTERAAARAPIHRKVAAADAVAVASHSECFQNNNVLRDGV